MVKPHGHTSIFVSLVSYCDNELLATLRDIFQQAKYPKRVAVGLINQDDEGQYIDFKSDPVLKKYHKQIRCENIVPEQSGGLGVCRHKINTEFYDGQDFYLQVDPHTRLVEHWDKKFISYYNKPEGKRIIVSTPWAFTLDGRRLFKYYVKGAKRWHPRVVVEAQHHLELDFNADGLTRTDLFLAGCVFAPASWLKEVPYDPKIFMWGEEFDLSCRTFGAGYTAWLVKEPMVWHLWNRQNRKFRGEIREKKRYEDRDYAGRAHVFKKLLNNEYPHQLQFIKHLGLCPAEMHHAYATMFDSMREQDALKPIRARALFTKRYSTTFKTHAGEIYDVNYYYFLKFRREFEEI